MTEAPRVIVAGGGIAGLTVALRLAERKYSVKVYEQKSMLGGDLASRPASNGVDLDVYPHMYLNWYHNFWRLLEDVTDVDREARFVPSSTVWLLGREDFPHFHALNGPYSFSSLYENVYSGVGPPADMFVFAYASIDLLAERLNPTILLDDVSVTGFLHARPYMTERAAEAYESFITNVWAIPSYLASAEDYRAYLAYCFADPGPMMWMPRGSAQQCVIGPLTEALEKAGVEVVREVQVTGITCANGRVSEIKLQDVELKPATYKWKGVGEEWTEQVDELVLAVPAETLSELVRTGPAGARIVEAAPELAELARLHSQPVPVLHLYFTRELRHIPPEPVGLSGSRYDLAFTDISQTWEGVPQFEGRTVLALSASDPYALPATGQLEDAHAMVVELAKYLDFDPGKAWGESSDIDWASSRYETNDDARLFINEAGTDVWRPTATCKGISNLSFAGDFCRNGVGMTTIESAVTTGLEAARAIVKRRGFGARVEIEEPWTRPDAFYVWLRYAWAPYAFAAKTWSKGEDYARCVPPRAPSGQSLLSYLLTPTGAAARGARPRPRGRQRRES